MELDKIKGLIKKIIEIMILSLLTFVAISFIIIFIVVVLKVILLLFSWVPDNNPVLFIKTNDYILNFKDVIYISTSVLGILATCIFSYLIWKANKKSADVSTKLADLEIHRDNSVIRESATVLLYTSLSGLEFVYEKYIDFKERSLPHLTRNWVTNLDKLYGQLSAI